MKKSRSCFHLSALGPVFQNPAAGLPNRRRGRKRAKASKSFRRTQDEGEGWRRSVGLQRDAPLEFSTAGRSSEQTDSFESSAPLWDLLYYHSPASPAPVQ